MAPTPINAKIEPDLAPVWAGDMTVTLVDANAQITNILDSSQLNSITVDWKITGTNIPLNPPGTDKYTVRAYLDDLEGINDYVFDTNPAGPTLISTGILVNNTRTFAALSIPLMPASVSPGLYGLTVVLTQQVVPPPAHTPVVFGFVDCGPVQFF